MSLKIVSALVLTCFKLITAASFSSVLVQNGGEVVPLEYLNYAAIPPATLSRLSAVDPVLSLSQVPALVSPCVSPCVIPSPQFPALPPVQSARILAYNAPIPNVPVVVAKKDETRGYQYAYAVFDSNTGDKKSQTEQSNGSQVQGQYSFIQPDGVRREVSYTADDLKGFNAVVKNIIVDGNSESSESTSEAKKTPPCDDKSAQLVEQLDTESEAMSTGAAEKPAEHPTAESEGSSDPADNNVISYSDVINCLQSKLYSSNTQSVVSPLTYMLIPNLRKLC